MGKSTVAKYLSSRGEFVVDTDVLARQLVEPGNPALQEMRRRIAEGQLGEIYQIVTRRQGGFDFGQLDVSVAEHHQQVVDQVACFVDQMSPSGVARFTVVISGTMKPCESPATNHRPSTTCQGGARLVSISGTHELTASGTISCTWRSRAM